MLKIYIKSNHLIIAVDLRLPSARELVTRLRYLIGSYGPFLPYLDAFDKAVAECGKEAKIDKPTKD